MKKLLAFLAFITFFTSYARAQSVTVVPTGGTLENIQFINANTGFAAGKGGIWRTTDQSESWHNVYPVIHYMNQVKFFGTTGYAIANNAMVKTTDAGNSWTLCYETPAARPRTLKKLAIRSENEIYAFANGSFEYGTGIITPGHVLKTSNGGQSWDTILVTNHYFIRDLCVNEFGNIALVSAGPGEGDFFLTSPDGNTWHTSLPPFATVNMSYTGNVIRVNGRYNEAATATTTDLGQTWLRENCSTELAICYGVAFSGPDRYASVSNITTGDITIRHFGVGNTWSTVYTLPYEYHGYIPDFSLTEKFIFILGISLSSPNNAVVIKYPLLTTGISEPEGGILDKFELKQNYPNPFNPSTKITYSLPKADYVKLSVYNLLGKEISTLANEHKSAGNYTVEFDGSKLSSGTYFYTLETNDYVDKKKMILVK